MLTRRSVLSAGLFAAIAVPSALTQTTQPNTYTVVNYYAVTPQNDAAYLDAVRTTGKTVLGDAMRASGSKMTRFSLRRVMYPGVPAPRHNYIAAISYDGPPPEPRPTPAMREYLQKVGSLRTLVGSVISRTMVTTGGYSLKEGDYITTVRSKFNPGAAADYWEARRTLSLPVMAARVKDGALLAWTGSQVIFPGGDSVAWDATSSTVHKDLASALANPGAANAATFAKVHPGKNYVAYVDSLRASGKIVRRELQRVVVVIDRASLGSSSGGQ
jgi:hypothetical protein